MNPTKARILADLEECIQNYDAADSASVFDLLSLTNQVTRLTAETVAKARALLADADTSCVDEVDTEQALECLSDALDPYTGHTEQVFDALYDMDLIVSALSEAGREQRAAEVVEAAVALAKKAAPYGQDLRNLAQCVVGRLGTTGGVAPVWVTFL